MVSPGPAGPISSARVCVFEAVSSQELKNPWIYCGTSRGARALFETLGSATRIPVPLLRARVSGFADDSVLPPNDAIAIESQARVSCDLGSRTGGWWDSYATISIDLFPQRHGFSHRGRPSERRREGDRERLVACITSPIQRSITGSLG